MDLTLVQEHKEQTLGVRESLELVTLGNLYANHVFRSTSILQLPLADRRKR